jgi:hypothetical protein
MQRNGFSPCQFIISMKPEPLYIIIIAFFFAGCGKNQNANNVCEADLVITRTITPTSTTIAAGIRSTVDAYGSNLCYSYSHNEVTAVGGNIYQIRIKGKLPCDATVCAQALYPVQTQINISPVQPGTYYLHFFNFDAFVKADTVIVQ